MTYFRTDSSEQENSYLKSKQLVIFKSRVRSYGIIYFYS